MAFKFLFLLSLLFATTFGAPIIESTEVTDLVQRQTQNNLIDATFTISGWPNIAEENCFAMLCLLGGNRVYQRVNTSNAATAAYRATGAAYRPFRASQLASRHTSQINTDTVSAEEFPWRSTTAGPDAYVFPATLAEQTSQGGSVNGGYNRYHVGYDDWFRITFTGAPFGQYCSALFASTPDFSVCGKQPTESFFGTSSINIANFVYKVIKTGAVPYAFQHVAGINKGKITKRLEDGSDVVIVDETDDMGVEEDY